ncbi:hypothetical protein [Mucilaginibacter endophyticus]|nr:hypothetical protein [Mucilaginibacter endophyticus]
MRRSRYLFVDKGISRKIILPVNEHASFEDMRRRRYLFVEKA